MKVWALFSIKNKDNQPQHNLVELFENKPDVDFLYNYFEKRMSLIYHRENPILDMMYILKGYQVRIDGYDYRLEEITVMNTSDSSIE